MSDNLDTAYDVTATAIRRRDVAEQLGRRPGVSYAAITMTNVSGFYLVALDGRVIAELYHDRTLGALDGWTGCLIGRDERLGPYHTGRQAAAELASQVRVGEHVAGSAQK